jgi:hypothetical protein
MPTRSKLIRRIIIVLELVILVAALKLPQDNQAATHPLLKHYVLRYYPNMGVNLFGAGSVELLYDPEPDMTCTFRFRVDNNLAFEESLTEMLFDFWAADAIQIVRDTPPNDRKYPDIRLMFDDSELYIMPYCYQPAVDFSGYGYGDGG